jgi:hypothetical protein
VNEEGNKLFNERGVVCDIERKFYSRAGIRADELPLNFHDSPGSR